MISVNEAENLIGGISLNLPEVLCDINDSYGMILQEDILADRDYPPFNRVAMDGISIKYSDFEKGLRQFKIQGIQKAGQKPLNLEKEGNCIEVMTGCSLPEGTDCVIRVEDISISENIAKLNDDSDISFMGNIHKKGSDYKSGSLLISKGVELLPVHIAVSSSVGKRKLKVTKKTSVALISTGDELVDLEEKIEDYQVRISNSYTLLSSIKSIWNNEVKIFHIKDEKKSLYDELKKIMNDFDILILSGGVSMGKFDFIPSVMNDLGVKQLFHKVNQRPGKPFWFGVSEQNKPVFGLPGNPVASLVCFYRYVIPFINKINGIKNLKKDMVILGEELKSNKMTFFKAVKVENIDGVLTAYPVNGNGSGDFYSLSETDGFVELENGKEFTKGTPVYFYKWKL